MFGKKAAYGPRTHLRKVGNVIYHLYTCIYICLQCLLETTLTLRPFIVFHEFCIDVEPAAVWEKAQIQLSILPLACACLCWTIGRICNSITSLYPAIHDMCRIYQRCQSWQHNFRIFQSFPSLPDSVRISWRQNKVNKGTVLELYYIRKIYCGVVPFQSSYLGRLGRLGPIYGR